MKSQASNEHCVFFHKMPHYSVTAHQQPPPRRARETSHFLLACRYQRKNPPYILPNLVHYARRCQGLILQNIVRTSSTVGRGQNIHSVLYSIYTACLFLFCWNIVCVLVHLWRERGILLLALPKWKKKHTHTRPSSIRAGFGIQFCHQLGQICE